MKLIKFNNGYINPAHVSSIQIVEGRVIVRFIGDDGLLAWTPSDMTAQAFVEKLAQQIDETLADKRSFTKPI